MRKILSVLLILTACAASAQMIPEGLLGGMLKSDKWTILKDKKIEEFTGNVRYDSEFYKLRAGHAVSDRAKNVFTLTTDVYLMNKDTDGQTAEVTADNIVFNLNTFSGTAREGNKTPLTIVYSADGYTLEASGKKAAFNTARESLDLDGNARVKYTTPEDFLLGFSGKAFINRTAGTLLLEDNVNLDTSMYSAAADRVYVDRVSGELEISGSRPVLTADKEEFLLVIQAEKFEGDLNARAFRGTGKINGWIQQRELK